MKCPCCKKLVKGVSFKCVTCPKRNTWIHPKCGGYSNEEVLSTPQNEQQYLTCNNCKKVNFLLILLDHHFIVTYCDLLRKLVWPPNSHHQPLPARQSVRFVNTCLDMFVVSWETSTSQSRIWLLISYMLVYCNYFFRKTFLYARDRWWSSRNFTDIDLVMLLDPHRIVLFVGLSNWY